VSVRLFLSCYPLAGATSDALKSVFLNAKSIISGIIGIFFDLVVKLENLK